MVVLVLFGPDAVLAIFTPWLVLAVSMGIKSLSAQKRSVFGVFVSVGLLIF